MADDAQKIKLGLEVFGLEGLEEANQSFEELKDAAKGTVDPLQAAVEALAKTGTVVEDLKQKIRELKERHEELNTARKAELVTEEHYKTESDLLVKSLAEKETILKRLTAEEKAEEEQTRRVEKAAQDEAAALAKITKALSDLEAEEERELVEAVKLADAHAKMMEAADAAAGQGEGEGGKGGFAGLASNVLKAEKVMSGLAGGSGFGRMGPMLESITSALGLAGGAGLAAGGLIFAFESLIPKIDAFIEKMTGAAEASAKATAALKAHEEQAKRTQDAVDAMSAKPTEKEAEIAGEAKPFFEGGLAEQMRAGIMNALKDQVGVTKEDRGRIIADVLDTMGMTPQADVEIKKRMVEAFGERALTGKPGEDIEKRRLAAPLTDQEIENRNIELRRQQADRMIQDFQQTGQSEGIQAIAKKAPRQFPPELAEFLESQTPKARDEAKEADRRTDEEEAERQGRKTARFEKAKEFNKKAKEQLDRDDVLADLDVEQNDPDQQFMERQKARRTIHNQEVDAFNQQLREQRHADQERKRIETDSRKHTPESEESAALKAERDDIMAQLRVMNEANVRAGGMPATPQFLRRAEAGAVRAREQGYDLHQAVDQGVEGAQRTEAAGRGRMQAEEAVREINQQRGLGLSETQVEHITGDALNRLPATGGNGAMAIQQAIMAAYQRGLQMQQQDMNRMGVFTEIFQGSR